MVFCIFCEMLVKVVIFVDKDLVVVSFWEVNLFNFVVFCVIDVDVVFCLMVEVVIFVMFLLVFWICCIIRVIVLVVVFDDNMVLFISVI